MLSDTMTLREVPGWAYVALAMIWTSTVLVDAAAISLDPAFASVEMPWLQFFAKRSMLAIFWMALSVAALAWFHDRPISGANAARELGVTSILAILAVAAYAAYMTLVLVVVTMGQTSFRESVSVVWTGKLVHAFLSAWLVAVLANAFHFYRRGLAKQRESETLRLKLAETELSLLRAQLEPHFLFNALNSIASLVRLERNEAATDALGKLGRLLRSMLEVADHPIVAWDWERGFSELYIALQKLRFGARLQVELRADGVSPSMSFPAFLLQPLIENAVRHGALADGEVCLVEIDLRNDGKRAHLKVCNALASGEPRPGPGLGLRNIESRLAVLYPADFGFAAGEEDKSFVVRIDFPVESQGEVDIEVAAR